MCNGNPHFDVTKLTLYTAILVLLADILALLVEYQRYWDAKCGISTATDITQGKSQTNLTRIEEI